MELNIILILRGIQALIALIVFALSCYIVNAFNKNRFAESPDEANFVLFSGIWTFFIALPYLVLAPIYFPFAAHKYILLGAEAVTMIFWFAGFIALGAFLPSPKRCEGSLCSSMQAVTVFGSFEWAAFVASLVLIALPIVRNKGGSPKAPATASVTQTV